MTVTRAQSNRDDFDRLLIEAGSLARRWRQPAFREIALREADRAFIPHADEIGRARFFAAKSLRDAMRALALSSNDDARAQFATAIQALCAALRSEHVASTATHATSPEQTRSAGSRPYWLD